MADLTLASTGAEIDASVDFSKNFTPFNPTTGMLVERLIDGSSTAISQEPNGKGFASAIDVNFGPAITTAAVDLSAAGVLTFKESGMYSLKVSGQIGRTGQSSVSEVFLRFLVNGVQAGRSVGFKLNNSNVLQYFDIDTTVNIPAGATVAVQFMRDVSGHNSGGLFSVSPTSEGVGTWNDSPSADIRVDRFV